jgi:hypothetical protein
MLKKLDFSDSQNGFDESDSAAKSENFESLCLGGRFSADEKECEAKFLEFQ